MLSMCLQPGNAYARVRGGSSCHLKLVYSPLRFVVMRLEFSVSMSTSNLLCSLGFVLTASFRLDVGSCKFWKHDALVRTSSCAFQPHLLKAICGLSDTFGMSLHRKQLHFKATDIDSCVQYSRNVWIAGPRLIVFIVVFEQ